MNKFTFLLLCTSLAMSMATTPASAREEIVTKSTVVRYSDLNLSSDEGIRALYQRIRHAARKVCAQANDQMVLERGNFHSCITKAVDDAVDKVNRPALTAMHASKSPRPVG